MNRLLNGIGWIVTACAVVFSSPCLAVNQAPTATLSLPGGTRYYAPATIDMVASASDSDGSVVKVEFYSGTTLIQGSADLTSPYTFQWTNVPAGTYTLKARAYDNLNKTGDSATIQVQVVAITTTITAPANNAIIGGRTTTVSGTITGPTNSTVIVTAGGGHSVVANVAANGTFTADVELSRGVNVIEVGLARLDGTTEIAKRTVTAVDPPVVALTGPQSCPAYVAPQAITFTADAASAQGSITLVEYYDGATKIGSAATAPYSFSYTFTTLGTHSVTARATDSFGFQSADSNPMVFALRSQPPTVNFISPSSNPATFATGSPITLTATASDPDGTVSSVEFTANGARIGNLVTAPPYTVTWPNPPANVYAVKAEAVDNNGDRGSASISVTVSNNPPPTVSLTSPTESTPLRAPATISFAANASDVSPGTVTMVEFLLDGQVVATDNTAPYTGTKTGVGAGVHDVAARATDNQGATTTHTIQITVAANSLPTVNITAPLDGATVNAPADVTVTATANDSDGTIAKVEFFDGTTLIGTVTSAPYSIVLRSPTVGQHRLTAKATDNDGGSNVSAAVTITVNGVTAGITQPADGATFSNSPADFAVQGTAATSSGNITAVELYDGSTLVQTLNGASPSVTFTFNLVAVAAGTHVYKVVARDAANRTATSNLVSVTVGQGTASGSVAVVDPSPGSIFIAPADIRLVANPVAPAGTIAKVDFYSGGVVIGSAMTPPYSYVWPGKAAASYAVTAVMTDTGGHTVSSNQVAFQVISSPTAAVAPGVNGSTTSDTTLTLSGTVVAPLNSAIGVNGKPASLDGLGNWIANGIELVPGSNTIKVTVNTIETSIVAQTITVTRSGTALFDLSVSPQEGIAPLSPVLTLRSLTGTQVGRVEYDFNGDGIADFTLNTFSGSYGLQLTNVSGLVSVGVKVFDNTNNLIYSGIRKVNGLQPNTIGYRALSAFNGMVDKLSLGNATGALSYFTGDAKGMYQGIFNQLGSNLPVVAQQLGVLKQGTFTEAIAEFVLMQDTSTGPIAVPVYLYKGTDGVWRLESM